jgi:hypothetical protein
MLKPAAMVPLLPPKRATMGTRALMMGAATPAQLRADGTAQRLVPPVALMPTLTARATVMNQHAAMAQFQGLKPAMMGTQAQVMGAAAPAQLRADGTAQRLVPPVALMPTLTAPATVMNQPAAMAQFQGLKPAMMGTRALMMGAAAPAKLRADGTAQRLVPPVALMPTLTAHATVMNQRYAAIA